MKSPVKYMSQRAEAGDWRFFAKLSLAICSIAGCWSLCNGIGQAREAGGTAWFALFSGVMAGFSAGNVVLLGVIWLYNTLRERERARTKSEPG